MRAHKRSTSLLSFFFIIACAYSQDVHYNYKRGADLFGYKTYQWVETPSAQRLDSPGAPNLPGAPIMPSGASNFPATASEARGTTSEDQLIDQEIKCAIDEQLALKGLTRVEKNGDLQVVYRAAIDREVSPKVFGSGWGARGYSALWNAPMHGESYTVPVGSLVVDLYDPATNQLIWRGDVAKAIELKKDPNKTFNKLKKATSKLFADYPPPTVR